MPVTARCNHWLRSRGQAGRANGIQIANANTDSAYRHARKPSGGACGMPRRATTNPVLQMSTNTAGIERTSALLAVPAAGVVDVDIARLSPIQTERIFSSTS